MSINSQVGVKVNSLVVADRCDNSECGAQALVRIALLHGDIDLCSHHYNVNEKALSKVAVGILDIRHTLLVTH